MLNHLHVSQNLDGSGPNGEYSEVLLGRFYEPMLRPKKILLFLKMQVTRKIFTRVAGGILFSSLVCFTFFLKTQESRYLENET